MLICNFELVDLSRYEIGVSRGLAKFYNVQYTACTAEDIDKMEERWPDLSE